MRQLRKLPLSRAELNSITKELDVPMQFWVDCFAPVRHAGSGFVDGGRCEYRDAQVHAGAMTDDCGQAWFLNEIGVSAVTVHKPQERSITSFAFQHSIYKSEFSRVSAATSPISRSIQSASLSAHPLHAIVLLVELQQLYHTSSNQQAFTYIRNSEALISESNNILEHESQGKIRPKTDSVESLLRQKQQLSSIAYGSRNFHGSVSALIDAHDRYQAGIENTEIRALQLCTVIDSMLRYQQKRMEQLVLLDPMWDSTLQYFLHVV